MGVYVDESWTPSSPRRNEVQVHWQEHNKGLKQQPSYRLSRWYQETDLSCSSCIAGAAHGRLLMDAVNVDIPGIVNVDASLPPLPPHGDKPDDKHDDPDWHDKDHDHDDWWGAPVPAPEPAKVG